jgi:ribonuclease Z
VLLARGNVAALTPEELVAQTRETYDGPVAVGEDLMTFDIGKSGVTVQRRMPKK